MYKQEKIEEVLKEVDPSEYIIAGEEAVQRIIDAGGKDSTLYKAKGGSDFDITTVLTTLSTGVIIIKNVIEIYQKLKPKAELSKSEIIKSTRETLSSEKVQVDDDLLNQIVDVVINKQ